MKHPLSAWIFFADDRSVQEARLLQRGGRTPQPQPRCPSRGKTPLYLRRLFTIEEPHYPVPRIEGIFWNSNKWFSRKPHFDKLQQVEIKGQRINWWSWEFPTSGRTGPRLEEDPTPWMLQQIWFRGLPDKWTHRTYGICSNKWNSKEFWIWRFSNKWFLTDKGGKRDANERGRVLRSRCRHVPPQCCNFHCLTSIQNQPWPWRFDTGVAWTSGVIWTNL